MKTVTSGTLITAMTIYGGAFPFIHQICKAFLVKNLKNAALAHNHILVTKSSLMICQQCYKNNKKLRYREEHSASVMLTWCTL